MYVSLCVYEQMDACYIQRWYKFKAPYLWVGLVFSKRR